MFTTNFVVFAVTLVVSYVIVTVKLYQRSKSPVTGGSSFEINMKMTRVAWLAVTMFLIFYAPQVAAMTLSQFLLQTQHMVFDMFSDVSYFTWFYLNNLVNPFLYFAILNDFRDGYKKLLRCSNISD